MKKVFFLFIGITFSLYANQFSNAERGSISGLGVGMATKINLQNKNIKSMDKSSRKQACEENLKDNDILKSFNERYTEALDLASSECAKQLHKIKW